MKVNRPTDYIPKVDHSHGLRGGRSREVVQRMVDQIGVTLDLFDTARAVIVRVAACRSWGRVCPGRSGESVGNCT